MPHNPFQTAEDFALGDGRTDTEPFSVGLSHACHARRTRSLEKLTHGSATGRVFDDSNQTHNKRHFFRGARGSFHDDGTAPKAAAMFALAIFFSSFLYGGQHSKSGFFLFSLFRVFHLLLAIACCDDDDCVVGSFSPTCVFGVKF